jgi:crotonobetainyl-CoA:carnitine CoA-transferase CaiB-like acyl-CoA transferase
MTSPLEGIKVVEVAQAYSGPFAAMLLADYGAGVIKLEPPKGDLWRAMAETPPHSRQAAARMGASFVMMNRNKRSIVLDLALQKARPVFHKLIEASDVLIENLRPGQMEKLGFGYESLKAVNPRLIYASVSAYGHEGAEAASRGFDQLAQARAGILAARSHADGTPVAPSVFLADLGCAAMLAYGVLLGVLEREKSGLGQKVEGSLLGTAIAFNPSPLVRVCADPQTVQRPANALVCAYRCADERYVILSAPVPHYWRSICQALGLTELAEDPAFAAPAARLDHAERLHGILEKAFLGKPAREWVDIFERAGVPCGLVQEPHEVFDDPMVRANRLMIEHEHPALGPVRMPGLPFRLSRTAGEVRLGAPLLGEHTRAVLDELGYDEAAIGELERSGVVRAVDRNNVGPK